MDLNPPRSPFEPAPPYEAPPPPPKYNALPPNQPPFGYDTQPVVPPTRVYGK